MFRLLEKLYMQYVTYILILIYVHAYSLYDSGHVVLFNNQTFESPE